MVIKILGAGCSKCKKLEENARQATGKLGGEISIEKITDLN
ncbi:MAG: thioredoxin family protein, partial [Spirochaetales bacterium]|nr:thioredoxin family protein [Spirochaetales bacterium]